MKLGIMQPYFFPYIDYWQLINAVDKYIVYDDVNYIKGGWINRNYILLNGEKHLITLSLQGASPFKKINEILVTSNQKAKEKLLKTLISAYKNAPYFNDVFPLLDNIITSNGYVSDVLYNSIIIIKDYLGIETEILISSTLAKNNALRGQEKVIDICKSFNTDTYINAKGGQDLYDRNDFHKNGIKLYFIKCNEIKYKQYQNDFVPNLSIIDLLMFNPKEKIMEIMNNYELI